MREKVSQRLTKARRKKLDLGTCKRGRNIDMIERPRIIDVVRKPRKCPVCGERVVDIIYGTGDMTEIEFLLEYRREGIMGGDNIPRRPPIWACCCGCKRFRKVNPDGTDAAVKVKMLKNIRPRPVELINFVKGE